MTPSAGAITVVYCRSSRACSRATRAWRICGLSSPGGPELLTRALQLGFAACDIRLGLVDFRARLDGIGFGQRALLGQVEHDVAQYFRRFEIGLLLGQRRLHGANVGLRDADALLGERKIRFRSFHCYLERLGIDAIEHLPLAHALIVASADFDDLSGHAWRDLHEEHFDIRLRRVRCDPIGGDVVDEERRERNEHAERDRAHGIAGGLGRFGTRSRSRRCCLSGRLRFRVFALHAAAHGLLFQGNIGRIGLRQAHARLRRRGGGVDTHPPPIALYRSMSEKYVSLFTRV